MNKQTKTTGLKFSSALLHWRSGLARRCDLEVAKARNVACFENEWLKCDHPKEPDLSWVGKKTCNIWTDLQYLSGSPSPVICSSKASTVPKLLPLCAVWQQQLIHRAELHFSAHFPPVIPPPIFDHCPAAHPPKPSLSTPFFRQLFLLPNLSEELNSRGLFHFGVFRQAGLYTLNFGDSDRKSVV